MKIILLLQIAGFCMIMLGTFSTSLFGKLDWARIPFRFRVAVGISQLCFLFGGIVFGLVPHHF
jgi:hypothetical protein